MLLGSIQDYDGLTKLLNIVPAGGVHCCTKCNVGGMYYASVSTRRFFEYHRYLPEDHPSRSGDPRSAPTLRTPSETVRRATRLNVLVGEGTQEEVKNYIKANGVTGHSPLLRLPYYDMHDQGFLDLMHIIKNNVDLHLLKRMRGDSKEPAMPRNKMSIPKADKLARMSTPAREKFLKRREEKTNQRNLEVRRLQQERQKQDALWELSDDFQEMIETRLRAIVCPASFYSTSRPLFTFTGSWKTIDWQHFIERLGVYALYGCFDPARYKLVVDLFEILSQLAQYGHTPASISALERRTIDMLVEYERIGPLQEQTVSMHLLLELVRQCMRWGPASCVWMYPIERLMGLCTRNIKSRKHVEANVMNRLCRLVRFEGDSTKPVAHVESLPKRFRGEIATLVHSDIEDIHQLLLVSDDALIYQTLNSEYIRFYNHRNGVLPTTRCGNAFRSWRPWIDIWTASHEWDTKMQNVPLYTALRHHRVPQQVRMCTSSIWIGGSQRHGCGDQLIPTRHRHPTSVFRFKNTQRFGRILYVFRLSSLSSLIFVKIQRLKSVGLDPQSHLRVLHLSSSYVTSVVQMKEIGEMFILAPFPDVTVYGPNHWSVLPWPRHGI
jgi:hypothetical protein